MLCYLQNKCLANISILQYSNNMYNRYVWFISESELYALSCHCSECVAGPVDWLQQLKHSNMVRVVLADCCCRITEVQQKIAVVVAAVISHRCSDNSI